METATDEFRALEQEWWRRLGASTDELSLDALEFFCTELVPHILPMMRARFVRDHPGDARQGRYDGLVSLLGYTPDPTIVVTRFCEPERLVVLHTEETRPLLDPVRRHCGLPPERIVCVSFDKHALDGLHVVFADAVKAHLGTLGRIGVELTGGTKPMAAALHFAAAMMNNDTLYLDYDRYRPKYRKPEPETLYLAVIHNPLGEPYRVSTPLHLGQMAAAATHELNQPVANLRAAVVRAQADRRDGLLREGDIDPLLASIRRNADRMARMIDTFRRFPRREALPFDSTSDVGDVARGVVEMVGPDLRGRGISLVLDLAPSSVALVRGPGVLVEEILYNLIVNARDALKGTKDPRVVLTVRAEQGHVEVDVVDNGPGLPESYRNRMFWPFITTKSSAEGSGLGLFLTHRIVRELRGSIEHGDAPGGGTRFTITLPHLKEKATNAHQDTYLDRGR
jgi:signal transduction histidine kinase